VYRLRVRVSDGLACTLGEVTAYATQKVSKIALAPSSANLLAGRSLQFTAADVRSFGWLGLFYALSSYAATWDPPGGRPRRPHASVFDRDGWRCQAPGCTGRRHLEQHHVAYRSQGGDDSPENLVTLCRFHHQRGEHDGLLAVRGRAPDGLVWRLGPASAGDWFSSERRVARA
jgi:hypothetical protein